MHIIQSVLAGHCHGDVDMLRCHVVEQAVQGLDDALARGQHRVAKDEHLVLNISRGIILDFDLKVLVLVVFAVSRDESIVGMVEHVEHPVVEWQSGTQDGGNDGLLFHRPHLLDTQWSGDFLLFIFEGLADFVGHHFADAFEVAAKTEAVLLDSGVAQFGHELVEHAVGSTEVVDFNHRSWFLLAQK